MSILKMTIAIDFYQDGKDRESMYLNIEMRKDNPTDNDIADLVRDELIEHLESTE